MKEKIRSVFSRLEKQRGSVLARYDGLSQQELENRPGPDQWNMLQVLRHLVTAEQQSLKLIERKMRQGETIEKTGPGSAIRHRLLKIALYLPIKFKAPKVAEVKEEAPDLNLMKNEWDSTRKQLEKLIDQSDEEMLSKAIYKHPRAGYLNFKQALEFFESHISHHQKQMDRIMRVI